MNLPAATRFALSAGLKCENLQAEPNLHSPTMVKCIRKTLHRNHTFYQHKTECYYRQSNARVYIFSDVKYNIKIFAKIKMD